MTSLACQPSLERFSSEEREFVQELLHASRRIRYGSEVLTVYDARLEMRIRLGQPAGLPNEPRLPRNCAHGDPSLTLADDGQMDLRKRRVEIGNSR